MTPSDELQGVWKSSETLYQVFDIFSQWKLKLQRKQRYKISKFYTNSSG